MPSLLLFALAWLLGLVLARLGEPWLVLLWLAVGLALVLLYRDRQPDYWRRWLVALLLLAAGLWRGQPPPMTAWPPLPDGVVAVRATVADWPRVAETSQTATLAVHAVSVQGPWQPIETRLEAQLPLYPSLDLGDQIEVDGRPRSLGRPADQRLSQRLGHDGLVGQLVGRRVVRLAAGAATTPSGWLTASRRTVVAQLARHLPTPVAGLAASMVIGERQALPATLYAAFVATGTVHLLVVSGSNISLVAGLIGWLGGRLGQRGRPGWLLASLGLLAAYALLAGAEPPVLRAAAMGGLATVALAVGRRADPLVTLATTVAVMAGWQPTLLTDLGFQLSCLATLSLTLVVPPLTVRLAHRPWPLRIIVGALATTSAASLAVEPLLAHTFGRLTLLGPLVNLLVAAWVPLVMIGGAATALCGLSGLTWLADLAGMVTTVAATPLLLTVETAARLPLVNLSLPAPSGEVTLLLYGLLTLASTPLLLPPPWPTLRAVGARLWTRRTELGLVALVLANAAVWLSLIE